MHQIQKDMDVFASKTDAGTKIRDGILTDDEAHYNFCFCLPRKTKIVELINIHRFLQAIIALKFDIFENCLQ